MATFVISSSVVAFRIAPWNHLEPLDIRYKTYNNGKPDFSTPLLFKDFHLTYLLIGIHDTEKDPQLP